MLTEIFLVLQCNEIQPEIDYTQHKTSILNKQIKKKNQTQQNKQTNERHLIQALFLW